jgi:hypothetical protein
MYWIVFFTGLVAGAVVVLLALVSAINSKWNRERPVRCSGCLQWIARGAGPPIHLCEQCARGRTYANP